MKKIAILLLSLALAAPVQAAQPAKLATVRANYVYTFARQACPKNLELAKLPNNKHLEFLTRVAADARMTNAEADLLVLMCFMYEEGAQGGDGLTGR